MATIGTEFTFTIYTRRWGHDESYRITLTAKGWDINHLSIGGSVGPDGRGPLEANFKQDSVHYSESLFGAMAWLHEEHVNLTNDELQLELQRLADWVATIEKSTPTGGAFQGYW